ncbi:hypothetical protein [Frankia sp. Cj5]|uniref:hypothetical protein n=1 Tax=Frankia sp. Cj5 TaxID=2880978 RepID=UPI001EF5731F|nr:hypothetical protein [Frankia sp. Cj5]
MIDDDLESHQTSRASDSHVDISGEARVGQVIGQNYGRIIFRSSTEYKILPGDPPERRYKVAVNQLAAGVPRPAERILGDLVRSGHSSAETVYYYCLSVLSGRSWNDLHGELADNLKEARKIGRSCQRSEWSDALEGVWRLLDEARAQLDSETLLTETDEGPNVLDELPLDRQEEISFHLDVMLDGMAGRQLETVGTRFVLAQRLHKQRQQRAWLFFEPPPAVPRPDPVRPVPPELADRRYAIGGLTLSAVVLLAGVFGPADIAGIVGLIGAGCLLLRQGIDRRTLRLCFEACQRETVPPARRSPGHWVTTSFVEEIHDRVDTRFSAARPHIAGNWPAHTEAARARLKRRLVASYGNAQIQPDKIDWLIRRHADQTAKAWDPDANNLDSGGPGQESAEPYGLRAPEVPEDVGRMLGVGVVLAAASLALLMLDGRWAPAILLCVGGAFAIRGASSIRAAHGLRRFLTARSRRRYDQEMEWYGEWLSQLKEQPTDTEMNRWLVLDKIYLRTDATERAGLTTGDLVTHVVTVEGTKDARQVRVENGPIRYSAYEVQIFLLSQSGVREVTAHLDFLTGEVSNERRTLFRYDALASAQVVENGVRTTQVSTPEPVKVERLRAYTLRLTLLSGQDITVIGKHFRRNLGDLLDSAEQDDRLLTLQSSGFEGALPILESVAAEGSAWIAKEHERRQRWARDWAD